MFLAYVHDCLPFQPLTTEPKDKKARDIQTKYLKFLIRRVWSMGGRITVVVTEDGGNERIVASTFWRPPVTSDSPKAPSILSSLRMGVLPVLLSWGIGFRTVRLN